MRDTAYTTKESLRTIARTDGLLEGMTKTEEEACDTLFAGFASLSRETGDALPSREAFRAMLAKLPTARVSSPYAPVRSFFFYTKLLVPTALGILIIVGGIGVNQRSLLKQSSSSSQGKAVTTPTVALVTTEAIEPPVVLSDDGDFISEDYETSIDEEGDSLDVLAHAYDVTI